MAGTGGELNVTADVGELDVVLGFWTTLKSRRYLQLPIQGPECSDMTEFRG